MTKYTPSIELMFIVLSVATWMVWALIKVSRSHGQHRN